MSMHKESPVSDTAVMARPDLYWAIKVAVIMALLVALLIIVRPVAAQGTNPSDFYPTLTPQPDALPAQALAFHTPAAGELAQGTNPSDFYPTLTAQPDALPAHAVLAASKLTAAELAQGTNPSDFYPTLTAQADALPAQAALAASKLTAAELAQGTNPGDFYPTLTAQADALPALVAGGQGPSSVTVCTIPDSTLEANPELVYADQSQGC